MKQEKSKFIVIFSFLLLFSAFCLIGTAKLASKQLLHSLSKRDTSDINNNKTLCKHPTINEFPNDFIPFEIFKYPGILIY
jgi:hypothetical protein